MLSESLAALALALDAANIDYMVIGGQAVLVYGEPRLTRDIDLAVKFEERTLPRILELTKGLGLKILASSPEQFLAKTMVLPALFEKEGIRVDIIFANSPYEIQALQRTRKISIRGVQVRFASPEDVIIHKAIAGRERDLEDIRKIIARQKNLDLGYIRKWLKAIDSALSTNNLAIFEKLL